MTTDLHTEETLEALQRHIEEALAEQSIPPLHESEFRKHLARVKTARELIRLGANPYRS